VGKRDRWMPLVCAHVFTLAALSPGASAQIGEARFTVRDSIGMTTFSDPFTRDPSAPVKFSPDKKHFAVVTSRGLLASNEIESSIRVFDSESALRFVRSVEASKVPVGKIVAVVKSIPKANASDSYASVITQLEWLPDSTGILFLAEGSEGKRQLLQVNVLSGIVKELTPKECDVARFQYASGLIYYTQVHASEVVRDPAKAMDTDGLSLKEILFPETARPPYQELWVIRGGKSIRFNEPGTGRPLLVLNRYPEVFSVSPNGRFALVLPPVESVPAPWAAYEPVFSYLRINTEDSPATRRLKGLTPVRYAIVDSVSGRVRALLNAPNAWALGYASRNEGVWSKDGTKLLVTNIFLPLDGLGEPDRTRRLRPCDAAIVEFSSGGFSCVAFGTAASRRDEPLMHASFGRDKEVFLEFWKSPTERTVSKYELEDSSWKLVTTERVEAARAEAQKNILSVAVRQDLRTRPRLWASDSATGKSRAIWDPNSQLDLLRFGEATVIHWQDRSGYEWTGGLVKPIDYVPGRRYPLVIQTHGFKETEFLTDGSFTTAFAAQPLASEGIMVLQMSTNHRNLVTRDEAPEQILGFESAIEELSSEGLVDPARVGIIGFSRTCYYVESALIADPRRFQAASITDGVDESYMQYLLFGAGQGPDEAEQIYGVKPFGAGLSDWVRLAPGFHTDRIETPLRIEAIGPQSVLGEWEVFASLRRQGKKVDLTYVPGGQHILQKPLERLASQQGSVDWFRFWLKGEEDPDPSKTEQYRRWRRLRATVSEEPYNEGRRD
jgi:dipeptidyl aminopeptidase/acylaminoacyl peptidase